MGEKSCKFGLCMGSKWQRLAFVRMRLINSFTNRQKVNTVEDHGREHCRIDLLTEDAMDGEQLYQMLRVLGLDVP